MGCRKRLNSEHFELLNDYFTALVLVLNVAMAKVCGRVSGLAWPETAGNLVAIHPHLLEPGTPHWHSAAAHTPWRNVTLVIPPLVVLYSSRMRGNGRRHIVFVVILTLFHWLTK
jgi:hypothetical protein